MAWLYMQGLHRVPNIFYYGFIYINMPQYALMSLSMSEHD